MDPLAPALLLPALLATALASSDPPSAVVAVVLGIAQDGGVPQANCRCVRCTAARRDPRQRQRVASLALLDPAEGRAYLVDATPDLPAQLDSLIADPALPLPEGRTPLAGVFLTHAHMGHYAGLVHFGREALASRDLPLYATASMQRFLELNAPWSQLVARAHLCPVTLVPGEPVVLSPRLSVTALAVPHRHEFSDTVAYLVQGPSKRLLWLPDIDKWERWEVRIEDLLEQVDYAFLDATFHDPGELPDRSIADIPHPLVSETVARLRPGRAGRRARVFLVHLNHSNALLGPDDAVRRALAAEGIEVAEEGLRLGL